MSWLLRLLDKFCYLFQRGFALPWKYNIMNNNSDFSIATMRRVAIMFFELGVVKISGKDFSSISHDYFFV